MHLYPELLKNISFFNPNFQLTLCKFLELKRHKVSVPVRYSITRLQFSCKRNDSFLFFTFPFFSFSLQFPQLLKESQKQFYLKMLRNFLSRVFLLFYFFKHSNISKLQILMYFRLINFEHFLDLQFNARRLKDYKIRELRDTNCQIALQTTTQREVLIITFNLFVSLICSKQLNGRYMCSIFYVYMYFIFLMLFHISHTFCGFVLYTFFRVRIWSFLTLHKILCWYSSFSQDFLASFGSLILALLGELQTA